LYDSEESSGKAGFVAGAGAGFHWMSLKQKGSSETERNLEGIVKEVDDLCL
jgi:rhamnogalacturonyl hydrolase YesR